MSDSIESWKETYKTFAELVEDMELEIRKRDDNGADNR